MPRQARVVIPGAPHHVTQRGNRRQRTFFKNEDYAAYLRIAAGCFAQAGVEVWAYCLMPNHVHLIATPPAPEALAEAVGATQLRYTRLINRRERWTSCLWQGRFASFPMDDEYLRQCARYVGLNPVRAGLTATAAAWPWSSVGAHLSGRGDPLLAAAPLARLIGRDMPRFFDLDLQEEALRTLRRATSSRRPLGAADWVKSLERATGRALAQPPIGRPRRREPNDDGDQVDWVGTQA